MENEILECSECGTNEVTHILVDYHHNIVDPRELYCRHHAFEGDRYMCSCCENFSGSEIEVQIGDKIVSLKPTYNVDELDEDNMCSDHP